METVQIYDLINEVNDQSAGKVAINVVDTASFVSLGDSVLNSNDNTEGFLNSLCQVIYRDIIEGRAYTSPLRSLIKTSAEYGAIIRKISVDMPELVEEKAIPLVDGQSVDQWEVKLPKVHQHLFVERTPYSAFVTIQRQWLKEAFRSEAAMESFISMVFTKVQNKLELSVETLGKLAICNYAGLLESQDKTIKLVSMYNAEKGLSGADALPIGLGALHNADFMRYATGVVKETMKAFAEISTLYNYDAEERFTPYRDQKLYTLSKFDTQLDTVALYGAFNDNYLKLVEHTSLTKWQGTGVSKLNFADNSKIMVQVRQPNSTTKTEVTVNNVVAVLFDTEALGAYRFMEDVLTTPVNARGKYYNTFWHEQQTWFNSTDENVAVFTLN